MIDLTKILPPVCQPDKHKWQVKGSVGVLRVCKVCGKSQVRPIEVQEADKKYL